MIKIDDAQLVPGARSILLVCPEEKCVGSKKDELSKVHESSVYRFRMR